MKIAEFFVNERTGVAHHTRSCAAGLVRYTLYGDEEGCFRWLYRVHRPGVQPTLLTDWRECARCAAAVAA